MRLGGEHKLSGIFGFSSVSMIPIVCEIFQKHRTRMLSKWKVGEALQSRESDICCGKLLGQSHEQFLMLHKKHQAASWISRQ